MIVFKKQSNCTAAIRRIFFNSEKIAAFSNERKGSCHQQRGLAAVPSKWSSGVDIGNLDKKRKETAKDVKKLNWEFRNMFGPLLRTAKKRRLDSTLTGNEQAYGQPVRVNIRESGYKHLDCDETVALQGRTTVTTRITSEGLNNNGAFEEIKNRGPVDSVVKVNDLSKAIVNTDFEASEVSQLHRISGLLLKFPLHRSPDADPGLAEVISDYCRPTETVASTIPSVTTILQRTMPTESVKALERWKQNMIVKLGEEGFRQYQEELFRVGKSFHNSIEEHLSGKPRDEVEVEETVEGFWNSLEPIISRISDVQLLETKIQHPVLQYKGVLDCVARYENNIILIEWKTSQRSKPFLKDIYDNPIQVAAYLGALNHGKYLDFEVKQAAVIVAYSKGYPADLHYLNEGMCQRYWHEWLQRLDHFYTLTNKPRSLV